MRNLMRLALVTSLALHLLSCATPNAPITSEVSQRIQRLAVISVTAQVFTRKYTGMTVFGNEREELDISGWQIDAEYEEQIAAELMRIRGSRPIKAPYQVADFLPVNKISGIYLSSMYDGANWESTEGSTKAYCAKHNLDGVLLVASTSVPDFLTGSNQFLSGAGFYVRGPMRGVSVMHLMSKLALLDCATGKPLAVRTLSHNPQSGYRGGMFAAPYRNVPENISRMPISTWTPEIKQKIRVDLIQLPAQSWGPTLQSIFTR